MAREENRWRREFGLAETLIARTGRAAKRAVKAKKVAAR
jgi:hypothetical protein